MKNNGKNMQKYHEIEEKQETIMPKIHAFTPIDVMNLRHYYFGS